MTDKQHVRAGKLLFLSYNGGKVAKPNYQYEKRQRDLAKKKKQEEKRRIRLEKKKLQPEAAADAPAGEEAD
ncbi:MAG: hypothetical protein JW832_15745 [Deltaproteobacteria bacterium]|nr:hypothetical protein [Deltaproteobacteria bacterium]